MDINYTDIQQLIEDSVERVLKRNGYAHHCHLEDTEIDPGTHISHHMLIQRFINDWSKIRTAFMAGVLTTLASGAAAGIWYAFTNYFLNGG